MESKKKGINNYLLILFFFFRVGWELSWVELVVDSIDEGLIHFSHKLVRATKKKRSEIYTEHHNTQHSVCGNLDGQFHKNQASRSENGREKFFPLCVCVFFLLFSAPFLFYTFCSQKSINTKNLITKTLN